MMDVLQWAGVVVACLAVFYVAAGALGPLFGFFLAAPAMAVLSPLAKCARLRRQNERMCSLLERPPHTLNVSARRSWWSYQRENLLLQGELRSNGVEVPSALPSDASGATRSERALAWIEKDFSLHIVGAVVLATGAVVVLLLG